MCEEQLIHNSPFSLSLSSSLFYLSSFSLSPFSFTSPFPSLNYFSMSDPAEWYRSLPPFTKGYFTASVATTLLSTLGVISPYYLYLDFDLVIGKFQLWRLLANFLFFGKFSMPFVFAIVLL